jgi:hypothetical protein
MTPTVINGLPAHILFVHVVVVLIPLCALALVICAIWPGAARRLGLALPVLALVSLVSVPLTTHAGGWLEHHLPSTPLIRRHTELGDSLLPWAIGLFLVCAGVWWVTRRAVGAQDGAASGRAVAIATPVRVAAVVLSLVVAIGSVVQVYRIGDSGARAAWQGSYSATPVQHPGH